MSPSLITFELMRKFEIGVTKLERTKPIHLLGKVALMQKRKAQINDLAEK